MAGAAKRSAMPGTPSPSWSPSAWAPSLRWRTATSQLHMLAAETPEAVAWGGKAIALAEQLGTEACALEIEGDAAGAAAEWARLGCPFEQALALAGADSPGAALEAERLLERLGAAAAVRALRLSGARPRSTA